MCKSVRSNLVQKLYYTSSDVAQYGPNGSYQVISKIKNIYLIQAKILEYHCKIADYVYPLVYQAPTQNIPLDI